MNLKRNTLVSIIVPIYNVEKYCEKCILSLTRQTYQNIEIVIIDNNSSDKSRDICERYAKIDNRIKVYEESKQGLGCARDKGLTEARGEWICFVDGDDFVHEKYVEVLLNTVLKYGLLTAQCKHEKVSSSSQIIGDKFCGVKVMDWKKYYIYVWEHSDEGHSPFSVCTNIFHKSILKKITFNGLRYAEDSYFTPRAIYAARNMPIGIIDAAMYYYYQREGSLLHSSPNMNLVDSYKAKKSTLDFWKDNGEITLYALFFKDFYHCMIEIYIKLCLYLPSKANLYHYLYNEILAYLPEARRHCSSDLLIQADSADTWKMLSDEGNKCVFLCDERGGLYDMAIGHGIKIIDILQIEMDKTVNVDKTNQLDVLDKNTVMIIGIRNFFRACRLQELLLEKGFNRVVFYEKFKNALLYGGYNKYLPFLLNEYRRLF